MIWNWAVVSGKRVGVEVRGGEWNNLRNYLDGPELSCGI